MECAFTSPVRTECGMFVMYCMQCCICPCQLFCSTWMCSLEEVYTCLQFDMFSVVNVYLDHLKVCVVCQIQNLFLMAQSTQIKSVISVPIKDCIHHYPRALFNDIPRVDAYFYDLTGSGRSLTTDSGCVY